MTAVAKSAVPHVYTAIAAVMADVAKDGIAKDRNNAQQGYKFRGIDDVYNALAPILSRNGLLMLPTVLAREVIERQSKSGGALFYVTVEVEFSLVSANDGTTHTIKTYGEAQDSGDKATNKAMSAAYKYAAMQAFCIPTEGDNDADAATHEVAAKPNLAVTAAMTAITVCDSVAELKAWHMKNADMLATMPQTDADEIVRHFNARKKALTPVAGATEAFREGGESRVAGNGRDRAPNPAFDISAAEIPY